MIPAFSGIALQPSGSCPNRAGILCSRKGLLWNQYYFTGDFRDKTLTPIYNQFAAGKITKAEYIDLMTKAFIANKK